MHTSPIAACSLTKGDVIAHGGGFLRVTENPTHDHSGPVIRVRITAAPVAPTSGHGPVRQLTFGLNQAAVR